jgi:peroxiredoxin
MSRLSSTTLRIGDQAPLFDLPEIRGDNVRLSDALKHEAALLVFSPGSWSPATRRQLVELADRYERLQLAGIALLFVVSQDLARLKKTLVLRPPPYPVLADVHRSAARDYGVYRALSRDGIGVTVPAAFIIDGAGLLRFVYVGASGSDLPDSEGLFRLAIWLKRAAAAEASEPGPFPAEGEIWLDEQPVTLPPETIETSRNGDERARAESPAALIAKSTELDGQANAPADIDVAPAILEPPNGQSRDTGPTATEDDRAEAGAR